MRPTEGRADSQVVQVVWRFDRVLYCEMVIDLWRAATQSGIEVGNNTVTKTWRDKARLRGCSIDECTHAL